MLNVGCNLAVFRGGKALTGRFKWVLMCLVNLLVFSTISTTRCMFFGYKAHVLWLQGACTMATRYLYYRYKVLCTATTRHLYYDYKVLVLTLQGACTGTTSGVVLAHC